MTNIKRSCSATAIATLWLAVIFLQLFGIASGAVVPALTREEPAVKDTQGQLIFAAIGPWPSSPLSAVTPPAAALPLPNPNPAPSHDPNRLHAAALQLHERLPEAAPPFHDLPPAAVHPSVAPSRAPDRPPHADLELLSVASRKHRAAGRLVRVLPLRPPGLAHWFDPVAEQARELHRAAAAARFRELPPAAAHLVVDRVLGRLPLAAPRDANQLDQMPARGLRLAVGYWRKSHVLQHSAAAVRRSGPPAPGR
ncbi:hypothetical protein HDU96_000257 [Phlyctochytrium bullatum]|nr:hypothetical protein HDU96_000257 [Phlyctochytrium bullatum]